jgi:hypothetical protein
MRSQTEQYNAVLVEFNRWIERLNIALNLMGIVGNETYLPTQEGFAALMKRVKTLEAQTRSRIDPDEPKLEGITLGEYRRKYR